MNALNEGDTLFFYLMEDYNLLGFFCVMGKPKNVAGEMIIKIKPIKVLTKLIDFRQFIHKLDLIKNPKCWGTYIQVPLRKLTLKDETLLMKSIQ